MVGRTEFIRSLKRDQLTLFLQNLNVPFSESETVDQLRRIASKFVQDNNLQLENFPYVEGVTPEKFSKIASPIIQEVAGAGVITDPFKQLPRITTTAPTATDGVPVSEMIALMTRMQDMQDRLLQQQSSTQNDSSRKSDFVKHCSRLKLNYDGRRNGDVVSFIEKFENVCSQYRNLRDSDFLSVLSELLSGDAEIWYRSNDFSTVADFKHQLRSSFLSADYDVKLRKEIQSRSQAPSETMDMFVARIRTANRRLLKPWSDGDLLEIVVLNVHPAYASDVIKDDPQDFPALLKIGRAVEAILSRKRDYRPPTNKSGLDSVLDCPNMKNDESLAKLHSASVLTTSTPDDLPAEEISVAAAASSAKSSAGPFKRKCFSCQSTEHIHRDCPKQRKGIFCFGCGKDGVTSVNCGCRSKVVAKRTIPTSSEN